MIDSLANIIKTDFFNNALFDWGLLILSSIILFLILKLFKNIVYSKLVKLS